MRRVNPVSETSAYRQWRDYEVEVVGGLEKYAGQEIGAEMGADARVSGQAREGRVSVAFRGEPRCHVGLRSVTAVHMVAEFDVPRPRGLLGHENLQVFLRLLDEVRSLHPEGTFVTVRISAAGADSAVFGRLREQVSSALGLTATEGPAQLQVAVRRPPGGGPGWQVLVRTTPAPLTARAWRVRDYPGALNAAIASVMVRLSAPAAGGRFVNLCCGSGTLMIERLEANPAGLAVGIDRSPDALECAVDNLRAAGHYDNAHLVRGDVGAVPLPSASVDELAADLPYGMLAGGHGEIERVYDAAMGEATRLAAPQACFVAVTTRKRLFESLLRRHEEEWERVRTIPLRVPYQSGYIEPTIYLLRRKGAR